MIMSPCKGCPKRWATISDNCHEHCKDYKRYCDRLDIINEKRHKNTEINNGVVRHREQLQKRLRKGVYK